jgi:hypothetical protein
MPANGTRNSRPNSVPHSAPDAAEPATIFPGVSTWLLPSASTLTRASPARSTM